MASPDEPVLGRPDAVPSTRIDTFPVQGPLELVHFRSSELTALCPVTDQPDFYTIDIEYAPASRCIETKSLKRYLRTFDGRVTEGRQRGGRSLRISRRAPLP